jgi:hypothetical protein
MIRIFEGFDGATPAAKRLDVRMLRIFQRRSMEGELRRRLVMILQSGRLRDRGEGAAPLMGRCPFCNKVIGHEDRTLRDYVWLDGSHHYVERHDLVPPALLRLLEEETPTWA